MRNGKVKIAFIENATARKTALTKKAKAISKMANDMEILCGVSIVFAIFNMNEVEPSEVFPSLEAVKDFMSHAMKMPIVLRNEKAITQEVYLSERVAKESSKLQNLKEKNNRSEGLEFLQKVFEGTIDCNQIVKQILDCMNQVTVEKLEEINRYESSDMNNPPHEHNDGASDVARFHDPSSNPPLGHFVDGIDNFVQYPPPVPQPTNVHYLPEDQLGEPNLNDMIHLPWFMQPTYGRSFNNDNNNGTGPSGRD